MYILIMCLCGYAAEFMDSSFAVLELQDSTISDFLATMSRIEHTKNKSLLAEIYSYPRPICLMGAQIEEWIGFDPILMGDYLLVKTKPKPTAIEEERIDYAQLHIYSDNLCWTIGPRHIDGEANTSDLYKNTLKEIQARIKEGVKRWPRK